MRAMWKGAILAESDDTVVVENNHYFPRESLREEHFVESTATSHCPWKGDAHYLTVVVGDQRNADAAWFYPHPKPDAASIGGRVAFWKGVTVES